MTFCSLPPPATPRMRQGIARAAAPEAHFAALGKASYRVDGESIFVVEFRALWKMRKKRGIRIPLYISIWKSRDTIG